MVGPIPQPCRKWLVYSVATGIFVILAIVAQYGLVSVMLAPDFRQHYLALVMALLGCFALRAVLIWLHRRCSSEVASTIKYELRSSLLDKLACINPRQVTPELRGRLTYLLGEGIEILDLYWGLFVPQFFIGLIGPLAVCVVIACIDLTIGLTLLLLIPLIPAILMLVFKRFAKVSEQYKSNLASLTEVFTQSLHGLPILKLYGYSKLWGQGIEVQGKSLRQATMSLLKTNQLVILLVDLLFSLGTVIAASGLALWQFQHQHISAAQALFIVLASIELIRPLSLMGAFFFAGALGRDVQKNIQHTLALDETPRYPKPCDDTVLTLSYVSFAYANRASIVEQANLSINKGELVVLTGKSGSGKSTLFKLIQGHLSAEQGDIFAAPFRVLQQMPYLFQQTLQDNTTLGADISAKTLEQILENLHLNQELASEHKEALSEGGQSVSGGQGARLSLARALVNRAELYLIDEPTRQLDTVNEQRVIQQLQSLKSEAGVLVISHSEALIHSADRILTLRDGQLFEVEAARC